MQLRHIYLATAILASACDKPRQPDQRGSAPPEVYEDRGCRGCRRSAAAAEATVMTPWGRISTADAASLRKMQDERDKQVNKRTEVSSAPPTYLPQPPEVKVGRALKR